MNKKTLFLILLGVVLLLPCLSYAGQGDDFCTMIKTVRDLSLQVGGSIVAIGWIIAGILYLTSAGGEHMATAKKALIACVIGTALVLLAASAMSIIGGAIKMGSNTNLCP